MKFVYWFIGGIILTAVFSFFTKGERGHYEALLAVWKDSGASMGLVESESQRVATVTADPELKFVATHLAQFAGILKKSGYATIGHVSTSSKWEAFGRGFVLGFLRPDTALKVIPLWWNESEFQLDGKLLAERYGQRRYAPACFGFLISGMITFVLAALVERKRPAATAVRQRALIDVTPVN